MEVAPEDLLATVLDHRLQGQPGSRDAPGAVPPDRTPAGTPTPGARSSGARARAPRRNPPPCTAGRIRAHAPQRCARRASDAAARKARRPASPRRSAAVRSRAESPRHRPRPCPNPSDGATRRAARTSAVSRTPVRAPTACRCRSAARTRRAPVAARRPWRSRSRPGAETPEAADHAQVESRRARIVTQLLQGGDGKRVQRALAHAPARLERHHVPAIEAQELLV